MNVRRDSIARWWWVQQSRFSCILIDRLQEVCAHTCVPMYHECMYSMARGGAQRQSRGDTTHLFPHGTSSLAAMVCDGHVGMHAWYRVVQWTDCTVVCAGEGISQRSQARGVSDHRGRVVIHDLDSGEQKKWDLPGVWMCAASEHYCCHNSWRRVTPVHGRWRLCPNRS